MPVPPPDHVIVPPTHPVAVNIAFSFPQTSVLLAEILGGVGAVVIIIVTELELDDVPHEVVQVAV